MSLARRKLLSMPVLLGSAAALVLTGCSVGAADTSSVPAAAPATTGATQQALPLGPAAEGSQPLAEETAQMEALYQQAMAAGGKLTVWAGGDAANRQDAVVAAFEQRFPEIELNLVVDLSKFHNLRIEDALAGERELPDVAQLQTTFDYDRWSDQGVLLPLTPEGLDDQKVGYAHPEGNYVTSLVYSFRPTFAAAKVSEAPTSYLDFLKPEYADGKLALTYPHDDDAVLYVYDKLRQKHGQQFLEQLRDQNPEWIRGTAVPTFMVGAENTETLGNLTGSPVADKATAFIPSGDDTFVSWNQRAAVFKDSPNTAAGELYIAWVTSKEFQSTMTGWNTRTDLAPGSGLPELSEIPGTDPVDFINWMADRENVATVRDEMAAIFGPVEGESPLLDPAQLEFLQIDPARAIAEPEPTDPIL